MLAAKWLEGYMLRALYEIARDLQFGAWLINKAYPTLVICQTRALAPRGFWFLGR